MSDGLTVHFGDQPHTTGWHLSRALRRITRVDVIGAGHHGISPSGRPPLLWIESGRRSLPTEADLRDRPTACWLIDTHRGYEWRAPLARAFGVVYVAQRKAVQELASLGIDARWLPLACPADLVPPAEPRDCDVDFVGHVQRGSLRERLLRPLAQRYGFPIGTFTSPTEMLSRYGRARVVVNVPLADDLNMRLFEAAGAGAFVVSGPMDGVDEILPPDLRAEVRDPDPEEWMRAIDAALSAPDLDQRARRAQALVLRAHTYDDRARTVLRDLRGASPSERGAEGRTGLATAAGALGLPRVIRGATGLPTRVRLRRLGQSSVVQARRGLGRLRRR